MEKNRFYFKSLGVTAVLGLSFLFSERTESISLSPHDEDISDRVTAATTGLNKNAKRAFSQEDKTIASKDGENILLVRYSGYKTGTDDPDIKDDIRLFRSLIIKKAQSYLHVREDGGDNRGELIGQFLRADSVGTLPKGQAAPEGAAWCAAFASYVLNTIDPNILEYTLLAKGLMWQTKARKAYQKAGGDYKPVPGDLVFFERGNDGDWRGHVGFVYSVQSDGTITTIEGNKAHPDFQGLQDYEYDPKKPDGVRKVTYRPDEFKEARILGYGDISKMIPPNLFIQPQANGAFMESFEKRTPAPVSF